MLKHALIAACLALPLAAVAADTKSATTTTETKEKTPQQQKMTTCNKEAGDKKLSGEDRKKFMSTCLSAGSKKATEQK